MGMPIRGHQQTDFSLARVRKHLRKAVRNLKRGLRDDARESLRRAVEHIPESVETFSPDFVRVVLWASEVAHELDGSNRLAGLLRSYLSERPGHREAWLSLVSLLNASERAEEAIIACEEAIDAIPEAQDLLVLKGELLSRAGKKEEAIEVLWQVASGGGPWPRAWKALKELEGPSSRLFLLKGTRLYRDGDLSGSMGAFDRAIKEDPRCVDSLKGKARILLEQADWEGAYGCINTAIEVKSTRSDLWEMKAKAEERLGHADEAIRSLQVSIRYQADNVTAMKDLGRLLLQEGKHEEAISVYEEAGEAASSDTDLLEGWRTCLKALGRWEEYREACQKLMELHPERQDLILDEAESWIRSGNKEQALELLEEVLRNEMDPEALRKTAALATEARLWRTALEASQRMLRRSHRDHLGLRCKAFALIGLDRKEEALKALTKGAKLYGDLELLRTKKDTLRSMGRWKDLFHCCEDIVTLDPKDAATYVEMAEAAADLGKNRLALHVCDRGLKAVPGTVHLMLLKAEILYESRRSGEALGVYGEILGIQNANFEAQKGVASCLYELRSFAEAEEAFEKALHIRDDHECWYYRGQSLQELGRGKEAIECFDRALGLKEEGKYWMARGRALLQAERLHDALYSFERVLDAEPQEDSARLKKAECLMRLGEYEQALRSLDETTNRHGEDWDYIHARIQCLEELDRKRDAYQASITLTHAYEKNSQAWTVRAAAAANLGLTTEALECLEEASKLSPSDPEPRLMEAKLLLSMENYYEALQACSEVTATDRGNLEAVVIRGDAFTGLNRHEDALLAYNEALALSPGDLAALRGRAMSLARTKRMEEALRSIEALLTKLPHDPWSHYWKSQVLAEGGNWEEALRSLNQALYYGGSNPVILAQKGVALMHLQRSDEGLRFVEDALSHHPDEIPLITAKASLLLALEKQQEALQFVEAALVGKEKEKEIWLLKAEALEALQRWDEAMEALNRASRGSTPSREIWLRLSSLHRNMEQPEAALAAFDQALELDPRDPGLWKERARLCESLGRWKDAIHSYNVALEVSPKDIECLCAMGGAYLELGVYEKARDSYQMALSLNPTSEEALRGSKKVQERRREERVESYVWRVIEFEAVNARPAGKEEIFKYCNIPVDLLDDVAEYVNDPEPLDILSLPEGELRRLEMLSRDVFSMTSDEAVGLPRLSQVVQACPHLELHEARRILGYVKGVFDQEPSGEQTPGMDRLMRLALELPRAQWNAVSLARNLRIGASQAKRLEGALYIFEPDSALERAEHQPPPEPPSRMGDRVCRKHRAAGIYQHFCGQYLCSACIVGGRCPVCRHPVSGSVGGFGETGHDMRRDSL